MFCCAPYRPTVTAHLGPLEIGADGVVLKPKFNAGLQVGGARAMLGLGDVRDGLSLEGSAALSKQYAAEGHSIIDVLESVRAVDPVPILDEIITQLPQITAAILEKTGIDEARCRRVEGVISVYVGVGVSAGIYLGWVNTQGYRMVGVSGRMAALAGVGFSIRLGVHADGHSVRLIIFTANVGVDLILHLRRGQVARLPAEDEG
jgi:hypothetical protein